LIVELAAALEIPGWEVALRFREDGEAGAGRDMPPMASRGRFPQLTTSKNGSTYVEEDVVPYGTSMVSETFYQEKRSEKGWSLRHLV
jgi:hypothetical protein